MNEKFQCRRDGTECRIENFEFIVSEQMQVNSDNSRAMSSLTFLIFKLNTLQKQLVKVWVSRSHGVMTGYNTTIITPRRFFSSQPSITWYKSANQKIGIPTIYSFLQTACVQRKIYPLLLTVGGTARSTDHSAFSKSTVTCLADDELRHQLDT